MGALIAFRVGHTVKEFYRRSWPSQAREGGCGNVY
jgi:hypothetical protein